MKAATCFSPPWSRPPGFDATIAEMGRPRYGWAVITSPSGAGGGQLAVLAVTDWERALATLPHRWLNQHPEQPAPVERTAALAEETWRRHRQAAKALQLTPIV